MIKREEEKIFKYKGKQITVKQRILTVAQAQNNVKTDCFAYNEIKTDLKDGSQNIVGKTCSALNELVCKNKECRFYKNKSEYIEEIKIEEEK